MIIRRWSDHVLAVYEPDRWGGRLVYVVDDREIVTPQCNQRELERGFGYDRGTPEGSAHHARPSDLNPDDADRSPA